MKAAVLLALAGCATPVALPPLPSAGGPAWTEVTSEHFTVWTDGSLPAADKLVRQMEHMRQVVLGTAFPQVPVQGRTLVIAFRNDAEVHAFVPPQFVAMAFPAGFLYQPVIVTPIAPEQIDELTHELAHVISFGAIPHQPHWFSEGLATFFETINLDPDKATVDVGEVDPHRNRAYTIAHEGILPMEQLVACKQAACMDGRYYATAWAVYTYLANTHPDQLLNLEALLAALPESQQDRAWSEALPDLPFGKVEHEIVQWLHYGKHTVWHFKATLAEVHITTRPLRDPEVLVARGFLRAELSGETGEPPEIAAALAADPTNLPANLVHLATTKIVDEKVARAVVAAHPDDWRSYLMLWWTPLSREESNAARAKLCEMVPTPALVRQAHCGVTSSP